MTILKNGTGLRKRRLMLVNYLDIGDAAMFDNWNDLNDYLCVQTEKLTIKERLLCLWSDIVDDISLIIARVKSKVFG